LRAALVAAQVAVLGIVHQVAAAVGAAGLVVVAPARAVAAAVAADALVAVGAGRVARSRHAVAGDAALTGRADGGAVAAVLGIGGGIEATGAAGRVGRAADLVADAGAAAVAGAAAGAAAGGAARALLARLADVTARAAVDDGLV